MDIQKQGFEEEIKSWYPLAETIAKERGISICDLYPIEWLLWQQAQKVAVPEGFVLVEKSKINTVVDALILACDLRETDSNYEDALNHFHEVAQSLGKAQEQVG